MKNGLTILLVAIVIIAGIIILWQVGVFGGKAPAANDTISVPTPAVEEHPVTFTMPAPVTPTTTTAVDQEGENYTVKKGDTLWKIAKAKYGDGSKYKVIEEANKDKLPDPAKLKIGMVLLIPHIESGTHVTPAIETPKPSIKYHIVKKNDTLKKLALRYYKNSSKSNLIFEANRDKLATPETSLKPGWKLVIPPENTEPPVEPKTNPITPTPSGSGQ